ncbi:hypothetical protein [Streptomyces sclerotialus]|uniref:hypothetical protein n=1 Tax=Streptomyces sclerotialus TaxID=1957 RepID=UPI0018C9027D
MSTRPWIVDDSLWALIEPRLPPSPKESRARGQLNAAGELDWFRVCVAGSHVRTEKGR